MISIKVNVRCACNTLKKEWICQDVLKEYRRSGRDPKEVSKGQFGVGLLACGGDCTKKVKVSDSELHLRKSQEIKVPADLTIIAKFCDCCTVIKQLNFVVTIEFVLISRNFHVDPCCGSCKCAQT